ncbi:uncharacterized protein N7500_005787, partial [Penicillium coprophilum]|uniref:uncharacterized protein n=1 Tax=Penicillium coprophilum TaxID=36646 RepID=UPI00238721C7
MKISFVALTVVISGSAMGVPFFNGTRIASNSSVVSTPHCISAVFRKSFWIHAFHVGPYHITSGSGVKRGEAISIPTELASLASDAQSAAAALAPVGGSAQKSGELRSIPTDLPSLLSDAQAAAAALASARVQKRGESPSPSVNLSSLLADVQSIGSAIASAGVQKRAAETFPLLTSIGTPTPTAPLES